MQHVHAIECYSDLKRKKILSCATTWMNLKDIMPSEMNQSQKTNTSKKYDSTYMRYLKYCSQIRRNRKQLLPGAEGRGNGELLFNELLFNRDLPFCKMSKFWMFIAQQCGYAEHYRTNHLKMNKMAKVMLYNFFYTIKRKDEDTDFISFTFLLLIRTVHWCTLRLVTV